MNNFNFQMVYVAKYFPESNKIYKDFSLDSYCVAPAYLVGKKTQYSPYGTSKNYYEIVYCLDKKNNFQIPQLNMIGDKFLNSTLVENIFENYDKCADYVAELNYHASRFDLFSPEDYESVKNKREKFLLNLQNRENKQIENYEFCINND